MARAKKDSTAAYHAVFPTRLRELMAKTGCTQEELAQAVGRTRQTVSQYTTGMSEPGYETLTAIARHFRVTTDYLLGLTDDPAPSPSAVDELGLTPEAVMLLSVLNTSKAATLYRPFVNDMIRGTMEKSDAFGSYVSMQSALKLPPINHPEGRDGEDPLLSLLLFDDDVRRRGYATLSAKESFYYHAEKVGEALTDWLIQEYQDQGAWNRKEHE